MRIIRFASTLALLLTAFATASAQSTASGSYQFTLPGEKELKYVEFSAEGAGDGKATGSIYLSDEAVYTIQDVDGDGSPQEKFAGFYITADIDNMVVDKNQAVMSGVVRDSSIPYLLGLRVLLTVEDNGQDPRRPDELTWGVYKEVPRDWIPSDAELKEDPGVGLSWRATDAERRDDEGYMMPRDEKISVLSFPLSSYAFADATDGAGDIVVRP